MVEVGIFTYGFDNIKLYKWDNKTKLKIGKFCSIAENCKIYLGGNHRTDWYTTYPFGHIYNHVFDYKGTGHPASKGDVVIGNDVWIAANVTIMSGVTIGNGAVIANDSHVVKDVQSYAIYGGNPCKFIRYRFPQEVSDFLNATKWWDLEERKIEKLIPVLCSRCEYEDLKDAFEKL